MNIRIQINGITQDLSNLSESWLHDQIHASQHDGSSLCVRVFVEADDVDIVLSSEGCQRFAGGGRQTTSKEDYLLSLWEHHGLKDSNINSGRLLAFLRQLRREVTH